MRPLQLAHVFLSEVNQDLNIHLGLDLDNDRYYDFPEQGSPWQQMRNGASWRDMKLTPYRVPVNVIVRVFHDDGITYRHVRRWSSEEANLGNFAEFLKKAVDETTQMYMDVQEENERCAKYDREHEHDDGPRDEESDADGEDGE
jgi:predicted RNA-binding Zn ribbon-like protein